MKSSQKNNRRVLGLTIHVQMYVAHIGTIHVQMYVVHIGIFVHIIPLSGICAVLYMHTIKVNTHCDQNAKNHSYSLHTNY